MGGFLDEQTGSPEVKPQLSEEHFSVVYDTKEFVAELRRLSVAPHVAQNTARSGFQTFMAAPPATRAIPETINARRGIEKIIGWIEEFSGLRRFKMRGKDKDSGVIGLHVIAYI